MIRPTLSRPAGAAIVGALAILGLLAVVGGTIALLVAPAPTWWSFSPHQGQPSIPIEQVIVLAGQGKIASIQLSRPTAGAPGPAMLDFVAQTTDGRRLVGQMDARNDLRAVLRANHVRHVDRLVHGP